MSKHEAEFSPENPFPLLVPSQFTYAQAQAHGARADAWLGLEIRKVEEAIQQETQDAFEKKEKWVGLEPATLLTPYLEIRYLLNLLKPTPEQKIIDLGAGYARMGFVIGAHYPGVQFLGYEISKHRVEEGRRVLVTQNYPQVQLLEQDLAKKDFVIGATEESLADYYFIYDFGTRDSIKKSLLDLQQVARTRAITVIGRGRASRDQIERNEPWLSQVVPPEHHGNFSIYRS